MLHLLRILSFFLVAAETSSACGLAWTLPQGHFEGVDEQGYVSYWEKIGEANLGEGLVIPVHINFNSHRESSSIVLGKGWIIALLESHVEPVDENCMNVLMPDGWTFTFFRNGNTQTWRGNAHWIGETNQSVFTITAPCGWKIKFDGGKIQEIVNSQNRTLEYKYNGSEATEVDLNGKAFVQVQRNPNTGQTEGLIIGDRKIALTQAARPRIISGQGQNLIAGFDPSLSQVQGLNGPKESFSFGTDKELNPTLTIVQPGQGDRTVTWNPSTKQIMTDGDWTYRFAAAKADQDILRRINGNGQEEYFSENRNTGTTIDMGIDGIKHVTSTFTSGLMAGEVRKVEDFLPDGSRISLRQDSYNEQGKLIRSKETENGVERTLVSLGYDDAGNLIKLTDSSGFTRYYKKNQGGKLIEDIYSPEYQKELRKKETALLQAVSQTASSEARDEALQGLALFYIHHAQKFGEALALIHEIKDVSMHFNIISQSIIADPKIPANEKANKLKDLEKLFPDERQTLEIEIAEVIK